MLERSYARCDLCDKQSLLESQKGSEGSIMSHVLRVERSDEEARVGAFLASSYLLRVVSHNGSPRVCVVSPIE